MKSQIEVLIHFKKFTNIDLFTQGIYTKSVKKIQQFYNFNLIFYQLYQMRVHIPEAQPYLIFRSIRQDQYTNNEVDKNFVIYEENIEDKYFYSQGFLIRYEDEQMSTNIGCIFRQQETQNIEIIIELLFLDKKLLGEIYSDDFQSVALSMRYIRIIIIQIKMII